MFNKLANFVLDRVSFLNYTERDGKGKLPIEGMATGSMPIRRRDAELKRHESKGKHP